MQKSQIAENGDLLRMIVDKLDKQRKRTLRNFDETRRDYMQQLPQNEMEDAKAAIKYNLKQMAIAGKLTVISIFKYLAQLANMGFIDNKPLRALEKTYANLKHDDKKFIAWLKRHPAASSYLSYHIITAAMVLGAFGIGAAHAGNVKTNKEKDTIKNERFIVPDLDTVPDSTYVIEAPAEEPIANKIYNVLDSNFIQKFVDDNWDDIVICLLQFETYRGTPRVHSGETRYTYGPGLTWVYEITDNGKIIQHECSGIWAKKAAKFTNDQIWEQVYIHIQYDHEVMPRIQKALKAHGITMISTEQLLGLLIAGYQIPGNVSHIVSNIVKKQTTQGQIDGFTYYNGPQRYYKGTMKRRWWCAAIYSGAISVDDISDLQMDVFANANLNTLLKNKHFQINDSVVNYCLNLENNKETVNQFIDKQHQQDEQAKEEPTEVATKTDTIKPDTTSQFAKATAQLKEMRNKGFMSGLAAASRAQNS